MSAAAAVEPRQSARGARERILAAAVERIASDGIDEVRMERQGVECPPPERCDRETGELAGDEVLVRRRVGEVLLGRRVDLEHRDPGGTNLVGRQESLHDREPVGTNPVEEVVRNVHGPSPSTR